jgi:hypothetical protein
LAEAAHVRDLLLQVQHVRFKGDLVALQILDACLIRGVLFGKAVSLRGDLPQLVGGVFQTPGDLVAFFFNKREVFPQLLSEGRLGLQQLDLGL